MLIALQRLTPPPAIAVVPVLVLFLACGRGNESASRQSGATASPQIATPALADLQVVPSPASAGSLEPQVTVSTRGLLLSWVERQHRTATLKFAERTPTGWTATRVVASGTNWFVSHADVPTVQRLANGTLVANFLVETDASIEAYNLMLTYSTDDGATWSRAFSPHQDGTTTQHGFASFYEQGETFGLVWLDGRAQELDTTSPEGGAMSLRAATFDRTWKQTSDAAVDVRVCECCSTAVVATTDGPLTAFRDRSATEVRDIAVSRLNVGAWTSPQIVHNDGWMIPACPVNGPMLSARDRQVVVGWFTLTNNEGHAFTAMSTDAGRTWGTPVRLDDTTALGYVDVDLLDDGSALASWVEARPQQAPQLRIRRVGALGAMGSPLTVADGREGRPTGSPRFARSGNDVLLAWVESMPSADADAEGTLMVRTAVARVP